MNIGGQTKINDYFELGESYRVPTGGRPVRICIKIYQNNYFDKDVWLRITNCII